MPAIYIITTALAFDLSINGIVSALRINIIATARASGLPTCVYFSTCVFARTTEFIRLSVHFAPVLIVYVNDQPHNSGWTKNTCSTYMHAIENADEGTSSSFEVVIGCA